ncbi:MAG: Zn-ribbon domain-containing OB-fold protein [Desulfomonilaceae bacterium]
MGFEQFGIVSFTSTTKTDKFVDLLKEGKVCGTVCKSCGAKFFPPRGDCNLCLGEEMEWFGITGVGDLITFTTAMYAPAGFEKDVPYTLGVAQFEDGAKVFGRLDKSISEENIKPGMKVRLKVVDLDNDRLSYVLTQA